MKETFIAYIDERKDPIEFFEVENRKTFKTISSRNRVLNIENYQEEKYAYFTSWYKSNQDKELFTEKGMKIIIEKADLNKGECFQRIFRPIYFNKGGFLSRNFYQLNDLGEVAEVLNEENYKILYGNLVQLETYLNLLKKIFLSIYPSEKNFDTYGHEIRNLIILCATEAEAQMRGILEINNYSKKGKYFSTNDYVKLSNVLKLKNYSLRFKYYPEIPKVSPFENWSEDNPTKSLEWYSDYNFIKHDRENSFEKSTLKNAINSICACVILSISQFGFGYTQEIIKDYFEICNDPDFQIKECFLIPEYGKNWIYKKAKIK